MVMVNLIKNNVVVLNFRVILFEIRVMNCRLLSKYVPSNVKSNVM